MISLLLYEELWIDEEDAGLPCLEDYLENRKNKDAMRIFSTRFLLCVIGKCEFKKRRAYMQIAEMATVSDEAFVMLMLDNHWDFWSNRDLEEYKKRLSSGRINKELKQKDARTRDGGSMGRYTRNQKEARQFGGWMKDGLDEYNKYIICM